MTRHKSKVIRSDQNRPVGSDIKGLRKEFGVIWQKISARTYMNFEDPELEIEILRVFGFQI